MRHYKPASTLSDGQAMKRLATLTNACRETQCDLEDFLLELHEDEERWDRLSYSLMASAMGVSRQAVHQRVGRLLTSARERRRGTGERDPNQLTLDD